MAPGESVRDARAAMQTVMPRPVRLGRTCHSNCGSGPGCSECFRYFGETMARVEIREERCKGCLLCTSVCPTGVLEQSERMNELGYKAVQLKPGGPEECKGCAFCAQICPDMVIRVFRTQTNGDGHGD